MSSCRETAGKPVSECVTPKQIKWRGLHANYLVWMEVGRVEYCRALGFQYKEMEASDGFCWRSLKRTAVICTQPLRR